MANDRVAKSIVLYPSCWFYNAGVMGLLRVLEDIKEVKCEFDQDGALKLIYSDDLGPQKVLEKWLDLTAKHPWFYLNVREGDLKSVRLGKEDYYPNQTGQTILTSIKGFFGITEAGQPQRTSKSNRYRCYFCQRKVPSSEGKFFDSGFGALLGASFKTFTNAYWMMKSQLFVCNRCAFILRCHHLGFSFQGGREGIFVNAPHFKLLVELNRYAETVATESACNYRRVLGMTLVEWSVKRSSTFGFWRMSNVEVITAMFQKESGFQSKSKKKEGGKYVNYFDLPPRVVRILLDDRVAYLLKRINEKKILDLVQQETYSGLEEELYHALRKVLRTRRRKKTPQGDFPKKHVEVGDKEGNDEERASMLARLLPELCIRIMSILNSDCKNHKGGKCMKKPGFFSQDLERLEWVLRKKGEEIAKDDSSKLRENISNMGFRLLEQVRIGNRDEVFYMLLKCFVANGKEFPDALASAIKQEDESHFRILLYSFLAPILTSDFNERRQQG